MNEPLNETAQRHIQGELSDREKLYYAAQGRLYAATCKQLEDPLPAAFTESEDGYIALAIQLQAAQEDRQKQ
ncbi:hypothetical protein H6F86_21200 [Phormidium sp. FACHB-592]|uniref:Uncharacterized protein n=1 Tax=Stenomitos frigidus AS-A4 TaxID=2933935 RepID=A0ABV0KEU0_9CYAN|nr:hypothetical protein [Phormidium sp. FACHB-592]MBD2076353.1 hypothetical protein [Phormidium sp. FACHB-592]